MPPESAPTPLPLLPLLLSLWLLGVGPDNDDDEYEAVGDAGTFCARVDRELEVGTGLRCELIGELAGEEAGRTGTLDGVLGGELDTTGPSPRLRNSLSEKYIGVSDSLQATAIVFHTSYVSDESLLCRQIAVLSMNFPPLPHKQ